MWAETETNFKTYHQKQQAWDDQHFKDTQKRMWADIENNCMRNYHQEQVANTILKFNKYWPKNASWNQRRKWQKQKQKKKTHHQSVNWNYGEKKSNNFTILNNKHEIIRTFKSYQYTPKNMSCKEKHTQDNHDFKVMNMWQILCRNGNKYMRQYCQKQHVWGNQNVKVVIRYQRKRAEIKTFFFMFSLEQDPDQEPEAWHNQKSKCINMYQRLCAISEKKIK